MKAQFKIHAAERMYERLRVRVKHDTVYMLTNYAKTDVQIQHNKSDNMLNVYVYTGSKLAKHVLLIDNLSEQNAVKVVVTILLHFDRKDNHYSNEQVRKAYASYKSNL